MLNRTYYAISAEQTVFVKDISKLMVRSRLAASMVQSCHRKSSINVGQRNNVETREIRAERR